MLLDAPSNRFTDLGQLISGFKGHVLFKVANPLRSKVSKLSIEPTKAQPNLSYIHLFSIHSESVFVGYLFRLLEGTHRIGKDAELTGSSLVIVQEGSELPTEDQVFQDVEMVMSNDWFSIFSTGQEEAVLAVCNSGTVDINKG